MNRCHRFPNPKADRPRYINGAVEAEVCANKSMARRTRGREQREKDHRPGAAPRSSAIPLLQVSLDAKDITKSGKARRIARIETGDQSPRGTSSPA